MRRPAPWNTWPGQIRALPARITDRAGRFRRTRVRLTCIGVPGHLYLYRPWSDTLGHGGLDLRTPMFAPCLLGCPGTARQRAVPRGTRSPGSPDRPAGHSISRHYLTRQKSTTSRLLICGFGVQVPGGTPILTCDYTDLRFPCAGHWHLLTGVRPQRARGAVSGAEAGAGRSWAGAGLPWAGAGRPWAAAQPGSAVTGVAGQAPGGTGVCAGTLKLKPSPCRSSRCRRES